MLAAIAMLPSGVSQVAFAAAGVAVELAGLALLFKSHIVAHGDARG